MQIFAVVGIVAIIYFLVFGIHEFGHYFNMRQQGIQAKDIVLLGWSFDNENKTSLFDTAWVTPKTQGDNSFDAKWDCIWNLFINCKEINKYYGID